MFSNLSIFREASKNKYRGEDFLVNFEGYSLVTAEITYRFPDHLLLLQTYLWQEYDLHPDYPKLHKFLTFWQNNLDGPIHHVMVCHHKLITSTEIHLIKTSRLH
jgi:uncharacterized protein Usg